MLVTHSSAPASPHDNHAGRPHGSRHHGREQGLVAELQHLSRLSDGAACLETHLRELSGSAARVLAAERCVIVLPAADAADAAAPLPPAADDASAAGGLSTPIRFGGQAIGILHVGGARGRPGFDDEDRVLLELVAVYIGKSLQTLQLQRILQSRFAQSSLARDTTAPANPLAGGVPGFARMVRILARSFYRELRRAGFGTTEVIGATSQIIDELSADLRRDGRPGPT
ncbi:MAG: GAF domain-containing protein [Rhodocyclaceae bacterium]|nr:GAF domain-containing protein [Rhodocyclaceae bacterium]